MADGDLPTAHASEVGGEPPKGKSKGKGRGKGRKGGEGRLPASAGRGGFDRGNGCGHGDGRCTPPHPDGSAGNKPVKILKRGEKYQEPDQDAGLSDFRPSQMALLKRTNAKAMQDATGLAEAAASSSWEPTLTFSNGNKAEDNARAKGKGKGRSRRGNKGKGKGDQQSVDDGWEESGHLRAPYPEEDFQPSSYGTDYRPRHERGSGQRQKGPKGGRKGDRNKGTSYERYVPRGSLESASSIERPAELLEAEYDIDGGNTELSERLAMQLKRNTYDCMICVSKVGGRKPVWSCRNCWAIFHLDCIGKWIKKSTGPNPNPSDTKIDFRCPGCQYNHILDEKPEYTCWCGKEYEPRSYPGQTPHSCGDICGRDRGCPHPCPIPCHPGPCPPCSAVGQPQACKCGKQIRIPRCGPRTDWSCGEVCGRMLNCGIHKCTVECHKGDCAPCNKTSEASCYCGKVTEQRPCGSEKFACEMPCGKKLPCGHICEASCHSGDCPPCKFEPERWGFNCACGSPISVALLTTFRTKCTDPLPTCAEMCKKPRKCGHPCGRRCHEGPCDPCEVEIQQECRCGRTKRRIKCKDQTDFICEKVCKTKKSCGRHRCDIVCCPIYGQKSQGADDHLCVRLCGRPINCGLHTCEEFCHLGNCRPCRVTIHQEITCACGAQRLSPPNPCGTKPPSCHLPCMKERECGHRCPSNCHPGDCPICIVRVKRMCAGGHQMLDNVPCHVTHMGCGKPCGKALPCGHSCQMKCHGGECGPCKSLCGAPRVYCEHSCQKPCHPDTPCPDEPCTSLVTVHCKCGLRSAKIPCSAYSGNQRPKHRPLMCDTSCQSQQRLAVANAKGAFQNVDDEQDVYDVDLLALAKAHRKFVLVVEAAVESCFETKQWVNMPQCDPIRVLLLEVYVGAHYRLRTMRPDGPNAPMKARVDGATSRLPVPRLSSVIDMDDPSRFVKKFDGPKIKFAASDRTFDAKFLFDRLWPLRTSTRFRFFKGEAVITCADSKTALALEKQLPYPNVKLENMPFAVLRTKRNEPVVKESRDDGWDD